MDEDGRDMDFGCATIAWLVEESGSAMVAGYAGCRVSKAVLKGCRAVLPIGRSTATTAGCRLYSRL